jgi:hypothetical protein
MRLTIWSLRAGRRSSGWHDSAVVPLRAGALPSPKATCIVCNGADPDCWCCVLKLPAPPAPIESDWTPYPDLQEWVAAHGGYAKIPWATWDAAVKRAKASPVKVLNPDTCAHCGFGEGGEGDRLLPLGIVDINVRVALHAACWGPWLEGQRTARRPRTIGMSVRRAAWPGR